MNAVVWNDRRDVRLETVDDPRIQEPTDAIVKITSTGLCGSDLHLYELLGPFMDPGDILGHEPMGIVEEVGSGVANLSPGDRVVVPFNISCGSCFMCTSGFQSQCETTQTRDQGCGAALFGYTKLYGQELVRRGGTISVTSVYGGMTDPLPMPTMFDKQISLHMGQANVRRWVDDIMPLLTDDDQLGVDGFATHHMPLDDQAADAYSMFQKKQDGAVKICLQALTTGSSVFTTRQGDMMRTIEESVEVQVPVTTAYNQWTQFEEFPRFMEGVESVTQVDDTHLRWKAEIAGVEREWDAEITEQHPDERVAWRSTDGTGNAGVVTFHRLDDRNTKVMLQIEVEPEGFVEKAGDALGVIKRRARGDLDRFKTFIEDRGTETGAWRGDVDNN